MAPKPAGLWCGYCRGQDFDELPDSGHPEDSRYSAWRCTNCGAEYEDNPGYGYFTTFWGRNSEFSLGRYSLNTGELLDDSKLPRTPEGIVRHSDSAAQLQAYLERTQVK